MTAKLSAFDAQSAHARTAMRAYEIWESEGRPNGRDLDHWLRAEKECAPAFAKSAAARGKAGAAKAKRSISHSPI